MEETTRCYPIVLSILLLVTPILASAQSDDVEFTGLEIAEKTISFLESLRHEDGNYTWASPCKYDYCTRSGIPLQQNPAWLALAYSGLYEATGEQRYLDKVKAHMTDLRTDCPPDNFSCVFVGVQAEKAYQLTEDESYLRNFSLIFSHYSLFFRVLLL